MASQRVYYTILEQIDRVFENKRINPLESQDYFFQMYPKEYHTIPIDIICGFAIFIWNHAIGLSQKFSSIDKHVNIEDMDVDINISSNKFVIEFDNSMQVVIYNYSSYSTSSTVEIRSKDGTNNILVTNENYYNNRHLLECAVKAMSIVIGNMYKREFTNDR